MPQYKMIVFILTAVLLVGCQAPTLPDPDATDTQYGGDGGADTDAYNDDPYGRGEQIPDPYAGELSNIIYFDFDSWEVRATDTDIVARHAAQMANNSRLEIRLEGHADERGSREYNIGLGERRSQAVRRMLLIQGASAGQISTVSFGEERPVAFGSSESDYAQNRRVEIKYIN